MAVLAAVDVERDSREAIVVGYDLASTYDDTLVALHVMSEEEFHERRESRGDLPDEYADAEFTVERATNAAAQQVTEAVEETLDLEGDDRRRIDPRGRVGDPAEEILDAAGELDPRFVVVGGRERSPAKQAIFGSVSQAVVRQAEQPVVTIMEGTE